MVKIHKIVDENRDFRWLRMYNFIFEFTLIPLRIANHRVGELCSD